MTPAKTAALNLCDYIAQVESRVITPMQATKELPAGTQQYRASIRHKGDDREVIGEKWTTKGSEAFHDAETLLFSVEAMLEVAAEADES